MGAFGGASGFIVTLALSFGVLGSTIHTFLVTDMRNGIHELVTGNSGSPEAQIDESLKWMQVAMSSVDMLESVSDPGLVAEKERATFYIGLGTGGPAITAETLALADCKAKGGGACKVDLAYYNQCAVMVLGDKIFNLSGGPSIKDATERGIRRCEKEDTNCGVYYSACTEPIFHRY